jgi:regulator of RNase E activity RraB
MYYGFLSIFSCYDENSKYVSENAYKENLTKQTLMCSQTLSQLYSHGVKKDSKKKLEFFFYTDNENNANKLSQELTELKYSSNVDKSAHDNKIFLINGWSTEMEMEEKIVMIWTRSMCEIGYKYDCDFDGWGTNVD